MENQHNIQSEDEIDLLEILSYLLKYWYWFVLSGLLFLSLGYIYTRYLTPMYEVSASVIIKQEKNAPEEMLLLEDFGLNSGTNNIDNEIGTLKSVDFITKVVSSLELFTTYRRERKLGIFYSPDLYKSSPYYVRWEGIEPEKIPSSATLYIEKEGTNTLVNAEYSFGGERIEESYSLSELPGFINLKSGKLYIQKTASDSKEALNDNDIIIVSIINPYIIAKGIQQNLTIATSTKQSSQLNLNLRSESPQKGRDFMEALINEYNKDAIKDKNIISFNTAVFIDERLKEIASELGEVENRVEDFRRENKIADIPAQVESYLKQTDDFNSQRIEIETQLNLLGYIREFISKQENNNKLIPNLGIKDAGLNSIIKGYNEMLIEKSRIENSSSENNPVLIQMNSQVAHLLQSIQASLVNEINASSIALRDLERENTSNSNIINKLPTVDREYTDILRQQEVKSKLFIFLLQKREETNLTQAAVAPKAKVIEQPRGTSNPVEPRKSVVMLAFLVVGIILPAGLLFLRNMFFTKIEGMHDLAKLKNVSVVGDVGIVNEFPSINSKVVVEANNTSPVNEMFRTLRNNLLFMLSEENQKVVLVTSTISKEGKTFIAANLAKSLSLLDKKVVLVGADIRNPQISNTLGIPKSATGFTSYIAGLTNNHHEIIEEAGDNFFTIQTGPIPPNPNELIAKPKTRDLIEKLRHDFDFIVIDSAPVGLVSDTFIISSIADASIFVIRENFSEKDTISFINNIHSEGRLKNLAVVLNQTEGLGKRGSYKYGYKYKYTYNYSYRYKYGYKASN